MFAITGITGQVGGEVARTLLVAGKQVRAVVRNADKATPWRACGCDIALADINDAEALRRAFFGATGVFVLLPPSFDPAPGFLESRRIIEVLRVALERARPSRVVCISTVGAQAKQENLLTRLSIQEQVLSELPLPITFLRPAWFLENIARDVVSAHDTGIIQSFLQPLNRRIPMVATADVGRTAAELLLESWEGKRVVELEGPQRVSPDDIAAALQRLLNRTVRAQAVPPSTWESLFRFQGMHNPIPRMQMLQGFNEGWLTFEHEPRKGQIDLDTVLQSLIGRLSCAHSLAEP
jgi:NAD(P)H dehydrogenase (quinone)